MAVRTQLFAGTHAEALARADDLDAGRQPAPAPSLDLTDVTAVDLEVLGEIAARAVRFGTGDLEVAEVDLEHELLFGLPPFLCEVLTELRTPEDPDVPGEVAAAWAVSEELSAAGQDMLPVVRSIVDFVSMAHEAGQDVYLWVSAG